MSKDATVPYTSSNSFIISATRACGPRYPVRSAVALHKDYTIPILNVPSVWLCITLLALKTHCSNETCPFWLKSPLNVLNFGILPTTCEATLGQEISCYGSGIGLGNCMLVPSIDTLSSLPTQCNHSPIVICLGGTTSHPVFTLRPNHISMNCNVLLNFFNIFTFCNDWQSIPLFQLWTTIGSMVVGSYTSPAIMSGFIKLRTTVVPLVTPA